MSDFNLESLGLLIHCPKCGNEMAHDGNSLVLSEHPKGCQLECGGCGELSQWEFQASPLKANQVPFTWGGSWED